MAETGSDAAWEQWWDGRCVAIRPDVPGAGFNPGDLTLIRSEEERAVMHARIDIATAAGEDEPWPAWLAPAPPWLGGAP